jgi:hypothetical protein
MEQFGFGDPILKSFVPFRFEAGAIGECGQRLIA